MASQKYRCENCGSVFAVEHEECPKCGCPEVYEIEEDEGADIYEYFDEPCSPCDTVGGI